MAEDPDSTVPVPSRRLDDEADALFRTAPAIGACIAWNACLFRSRPVERRAKVA